MATYKNTRKKYPLPNAASPEVHERADYPASKHPSPEVLAAKWLGLSPSFTNDFKWIESARKGIQKEALLSVSKRMGLDLNSLCSLLHMSTRTFQRLPENSTLDIYSSEQAIELALVLAKATQIFSDDASTKKWLHTPLLALNGQSPVAVLDTGFGVKMVMQTLGRLEQGVYS